MSTAFENICQKTVHSYAKTAEEQANVLKNFYIKVRLVKTLEIFINQYSLSASYSAFVRYELCNTDLRGYYPLQFAALVDNTCP